jgi:long-chain acyl-CoA synthetase
MNDNKSASAPSVLGARIGQVLALDPDSPALEFEDAWLPWRYFSEVGEQLDALLAAAGLGAGSAIGFAARNRPAHAAAMVGLLASERCIVIFNPFVSADKLGGDLAKEAIPALIADEEDWALPALRDWAARTGAIAIALSMDRARPVRVLPEFSRVGTGPYKQPALGVAMEMLTSGTTGEPKRVLLKYATLAAAMQDGIRSESGKGEIKLKRSAAILYAPLVHAGGFYGLMFSIYEARPIALLQKFTVPGWQAAMRRHQPRFASLVPTLIRMILDAKVPKDDLSSLIAVRSGTAPLDAETHRAFEDTYGIPILINYGATEFAGAVAGWTLDEYQKFGRDKFGSVGRARDDIALRVIDPESSKVLGSGQVGVLEIRAMRLGDQADWIRTTDLACIDADGFLFMHGRSDDAIIRGGFKVLPEQVADGLRRHDAVADVQVVGVDDARLGQVPVAALEIKPGHPIPTADELELFARQHLVAYQVPTRFLIVDALPRTPSLKISRPAVKALFVPG